MPDLQQTTADPATTEDQPVLKYRVWEICWDVNPPEPIDEVIICVPTCTSDNLARAVQQHTGFLPIMAEYELLGPDSGTN